MTATLEDEEIEFPPLESAVTETPSEDEPVKKTRRRRSDAGQPRGSRAPRVTTTRKLETDLLVPIAMFAQGLSMALPTAAAVLMNEGERTSKAIVAFAATRPKMLAALQRGAQIGPSVELARIGAMVVLAAAIDLNRFPPDHPMAQMTGVTALHMEMMGHMASPPQEAPPPDPSTGGFDNIQPVPDGFQSPPMYAFDGFNPDGTFESPGQFRAGEGAQVRNDE